MNSHRKKGCRGCDSNHPSQKYHMEEGGCLATPPPSSKPISPIRKRGKKNVKNVRARDERSPTRLVFEPKTFSQDEVKDLITDITCGQDYRTLEQVFEPKTVEEQESCLKRLARCGTPLWNLLGKEHQTKWLSVLIEKKEINGRGKGREGS